MVRHALRTTALSLLLGACGLLISACSDGGGTSSSGPRTFTLDSVAGAVVPTWSGQRSMDLYFSSDPDCNWQHYGSCPHSGLVVGLDSGTRVGQAEGLELGRNYAFALFDGEQYSPVMGGVARQPGPVSRILSLQVHEGRLFAAGNIVAAGVDFDPGVIVDLDRQRTVGVSGGFVWDYSAAIADGDGGWLVSGLRWYPDDSDAQVIQRRRHNGFVEPGWEVVVDAPVHAMVRDGNRVIVAGEFTEVDGTPRAHLAMIDLASGALLPALPEPDAAVYSLALDGQTLYLGGDFEAVDAFARPHLAAIDLAAGEVLNWSAATDNTVEALLVVDEHLLLGGAFTEVQEQSQAHLGAVSTDTGQYISVPGANDRVRTLAAVGDRLYLGGNFTEVDTESRPYLAALALADYELTSLDLQLDDPVFALATEDEWLYLGGDFSAVRGDTHWFVAGYNTRTEEVSDLGVRVDSPTTALAVDQGRAFVSAYLLHYPLRGLVAFDKDTWDIVDNMPQFHGDVTAMTIEGDMAYVGGQLFDEPLYNRQISAFDVRTGELADWSVSVNGRDVTALLVHDNRLYVGGDFNIGGNLLAIDLDTGERVNEWPADAPNNPSTGDGITAMASDGERLYIGGNFSSVGDADRTHVAALNLADGTVLDWAPEIGGTWIDINAIAVHEDRVYVGGRFTAEYSGVSYENLMAFTQSDAVEPVPDWNPSMNERVSSLSVSNDHLAVGGEFSRFAGQDRDGLALIDLSDHSLLDLAPEVGADRNMRVLLHDDGLHVYSRRMPRDGELGYRTLKSLDLLTGEPLF